MATEETSAQAPVGAAHDGMYIVGIGASAGGLDAIERFFDNMPAQTGMAFVVVQHLSPDFKSLMDELLARHTAMKICRVEDGMPVEPNGIYLIPPKMNMVLKDGRLRLSEQDPAAGLNLPIDIFFHSLGESAGDRGIAVVLSGTGSDGSRGLKTVHEAGGLVVVQDKDSAGFDGMPKSALATGVVDLVTKPEKMPPKIMEYVEHPKLFRRREEDGDFEGIADGDLASIFRLFRSQYGIDFSFYRATTIHRRLERRVKICECETLAEYRKVLEEDPNEVELAYRDLLVEVTQFFRDADAFDRLNEDVIPGLLQDSRHEIRVWVPGCATGEEAYSLAMLLHHHSEKMDTNHDIKVFATDMHQTSLETGSSAVYSANSVAKLSDEFRKRYFVRQGDLFHVTKELRQMVIFAPHDITRDPPFTKIDLISCRNVLIYLETAIQKRVLSLFHFGLKVGGALFLGPSESVGDLNKEFEVIDQHWRIFRKLRDVRLAQSNRISAAQPLNNIIRGPSYISTAVRPEKGWLIPEVFQDLLHKYVPPSLLINEQQELVHSFGNARHFLTQPEGNPTFDVIKMLSGDLRMAASAALHRAKQSNERTAFQGVRSEGGKRSTTVIVEPCIKGSEKMYLLCLEDQPVEPKPEFEGGEQFDSTDQSVERIETLERELAYTKESLQATVEELETSNEELQSTNEELVASNEELQSTNEELHSVNEELYTVNAEHQRKIDELTQVTNDMDNLLTSTEIGTIFLDRDLCIRKFTPSISDAFKVLDQDIGRPIDHIAYNFDNPSFLDDVREVLGTGEARDLEVHSRDGKPFLNRIRPYRTETGKIDGIVVSFIDASPLKTAEANLAARAEELAESNDRLARFNRLATNRESQMVSMKREINQLLAELDREPKFDLSKIDEVT